MLETMVLSAKLTTLDLLHSAMVKIKVNIAILCGAMFQLNALLLILLFPLSQTSLLLESTSVIRLAVKNTDLQLSLNVIFQLTLPLMSVKLRLLKPMLKLLPPLLPLLKLKLRLMLLLHRLLLMLPFRLPQMPEHRLLLMLLQRLKKKL